MYKTIRRSIVLLAFLVGAAHSGEIERDSDTGESRWKAGVDGVEIEWAADGSVQRIYSKQSVPVEFADRRGIKKAQVIAEEKAKARIIRFMEQSVSSTRVVTEIQNDISTASQRRETGSEAQVVKQDDRLMIENLTEITTSFASGSLRGVVVLESGYDESLEEAWVAVGISQKTLAASRGVEEMLQEELNPSQAESNVGSDGLGGQESETRKIGNDDW